MKIDKDSLELLGYISQDFVLYTSKGLAAAYHVGTGDQITKDGFKLYCDKHYGDCLVVDDQGNSKSVASGDIWWTCDFPEKRVVRRIVMEPTSKPEAEDPAGPEVFNRWHVLKKSMCEPNLSATPGDCQILLDHLMYISDGDAVGTMYFLNWLAQLYQKPEIKIPTAIMFYSKYGRIGKTLLYRLLSRVFGQPLVGTAEGHKLHDKFMDAIEHKRLMVLNELARNDKADGYERFKNIVSEEFISFEGKGRASKEVRNTVHFIITTNNSDALPLMDGDGRVAVLRCEAKRRPDEYYKKLVAWIDGPGAALFAGVLANWQFPADWDAYAPVPQTEAALKTQKESRPMIHRFIEGLIEERRPPFDKDIGTCLGLIAQLGTLYPETTKQAKVNIRSLPFTLEALGYPGMRKINYRKADGSPSQSRWLCWRNILEWENRKDADIAKELGL